MPHITIEYSLNVALHHDIQELVDAEHWRIADGDPDYAFVAIAIRVGPGRTDEAKTNFITAVLDAAEAHLNETQSPLAIAWSVELNEIDPATRINRNYVRTRLNDSTPDDRSQKAQEAQKESHTDG